MDNFVVPIEEPGQIQSAVGEIRDLFWQAGFNCRQFLSNEREEILKLPIDWQETKEQVSLLGVQWDTVTDEFLFRLPSFKVDSKLTKRSILSHVASVYDPCGLISPALLPVKNIQAKFGPQKLMLSGTIVLAKNQEANLSGQFPLGKTLNFDFHVEVSVPKSDQIELFSSMALRMHLKTELDSQFMCESKVISK